MSSQSVRNNNPPAMRVRDKCYTKKSPFRSIIELFKLNNTNRKVILWLIKILEGHLMPDHVHMLVSIPPKISVSQFMVYLKV